MGRDGTTRLWSIEDGREVASVAHVDPILAVVVQSGRQTARHRGRGWNRARVEHRASGYVELALHRHGPERITGRVAPPPRRAALAAHLRELAHTWGLSLAANRTVRLEACDTTSAMK